MQLLVKVSTFNQSQFLMCPSQVIRVKLFARCFWILNQRVNLAFCFPVVMAVARTTLIFIRHSIAQCGQTVLRGKGRSSCFYSFFVTNDGAFCVHVACTLIVLSQSFLPVVLLAAIIINGFVDANSSADVIVAD
jgi:hypothetical protein